MPIELYLSTYFDEICTDCHVTLCLKCSGFFFSYWMFFIIICIEQLAKYKFCYKAWFNTSSFWSYLHFGELCECGFYDRLLSLYQYIVFEGNRVLTLNLTLTESTSEMYSWKYMLKWPWIFGVKMFASFSIYAKLSKIIS